MLVITNYVCISFVSVFSCKEVSVIYVVIQCANKANCFDEQFANYEQLITNHELLRIIIYVVHKRRKSGGIRCTGIGFFRTFVKLTT